MSLYFLYGEDTYSSWQKLQQVKARYIQTAGDTNVAILEGVELTGSHFHQQVTTLPFLATSRLVIIKNMIREGKKEALEAVTELLIQVPTSSVVFFYEAGLPDQRNRLFKALNQPKLAQVFPLLVQPKLSQFAQRYLLNWQVKIEPPALEFLLSLTGSDLWRLTTELDKLALNRIDQQPAVIVRADIEQLVIGRPAVKIFDLTDACGARNSQKALRLLDQLLTDDNGFLLLATLAGHYRQLLVVADWLRQGRPPAQVGELLKLPPFVARKLLDQVRHYSWAELQTIYRYLYHLDLLVKQSAVDLTTGLTVLMAELNHQPSLLPDLTEEAVLQ